MGTTGITGLLVVVPGSVVTAEANRFAAQATVNALEFKLTIVVCRPIAGDRASSTWRISKRLLVYKVTVQDLPQAQDT